MRMMMVMVVVLGWCLLGAGEAGEMEVSKDAGLLVGAKVKASELSVYGVRLGDSVEKIPASAGVTRQPLQSRPREAVYTGKNVWYYAHDGVIYRIKVCGDILKDMPPYDATRLQMALGKADENITDERTVTSCVRFFGRHMQYVVYDDRELPVLVEVDLYAP